MSNLKLKAKTQRRKHFFSYMNKIGRVSDEELFELKNEIKECKDEWFKTVHKYDAPQVDIEDLWC